ncbi:MAG: hypothetical protein J0J04_07635 [Microbacterium sp.]|uniref:hypothetical protein n=1 Tax=Microbacterium sp. TaxID=51671 RepID=UPI001ACF3D6F|nr:hypothetical protein [Microbacterium sp.]MBN9214669.1 hypothetical protein [Microbacterium sp.]
MRTLLTPDITAELASDVSDAARCERPGEHDHAADTAAVCRRGCGTTLLMCEPHMDLLRAQVSLRALSGARFGCALCRSESTTLDDVFDVSPLRSGE